MKMKNSIRIALLGFVAFVTGFVSCNNAEYSLLGTHAFVSESAANKNTKVTITELGADAEITACLSEAVSQDVKLKFVVDPTVLDRYNEKEAAGYIVLPADVYEIDSEVTIKAGAFSAEATKIHIKPLPKEYVGESYALPLRLVCEDGSVPTTTTTATYVITTESVVVSSFPMFIGGAGIGNISNPEKFPLNLPQFTIEVRFQISNTADRNRAVFSGGPVLLRFEDPQNDTPDHKKHSLVQFQGDGWYMNPSKSFVPNKWQHLALTYDGKAVTLYINGVFAGTKEGVNTPEFLSCSWFSGDHWSSKVICKILCAEARIWSVCRTEAQVQNNMITVSAKSKGLEACWRFNEGEGNTFLDCTGNNRHMTTSVNFQWIPGIKSTDEVTPWPAE